MSTIIKTGICSYGMSGKLFHGPFIDAHPGFELTAIVERSKNDSRKKYAHSRLYRTLDELLAHSNCAEIIELHGVAQGINLDALRSRPGVSRLEGAGGQIRIHVKNAASLLEPLHQIISRSRHPVHLKISPPSLERLFLELTGRELRD